MSLYSDGTRIIESSEDELQLEWPLNIDIRVSTKCAFGENPKGESICDFCHESAKTDGVECDYKLLFEKLEPLPAGIELAIGANEVTDGLFNFIEKCSTKGFIVNLTINQGHVRRDERKISYLIQTGSIKGLGISYRSGLLMPPESILNYKNTVWHVIAGIDDVGIIKSLASKGVRKILILGEKDFGFNKGRVNLKSESHKWWFRKLHELFDVFEVVSFDNLAIEQLKVFRFLSEETIKTFYQGEHSFYINAVTQHFHPSSRSFERDSWYEITAQDYFKSLQTC